MSASALQPPKRARHTAWPWAGLGVWLCGLFTVVSALAGPAPAAASAPTDARQWLQRIHDAAMTRSFQGTVVFNGGGLSSSTRLLQVCDGPQRYERAEALDGKHRVLYRHNGQQLTVWPADRVAVKGLRDLSPEFPALAAAAPQRALEHYTLRALGRDRMAGHDAEVLLLQPRDGLRFAQRLWAERGTGLLLRGELLGPQGEVLESVAFTELNLTGKLSSEPLAQAMKRTDGLQLLRSQASQTQLEAEGWQQVRSVPGFSLLGCTRRPLEPASTDPAVPLVLQSVFSDGLAQVSVFVEPFDPLRHKQAQRSVLGATHTSSLRRGDWWITVVGEVPMATVQQFEHVLERRR